MWSSEAKILGNPFDRKLAFKTEIKILISRFNYCPLIWVFCYRTSNNMIKKSQEDLDVTLNDHISDFDTLLKNKSDTFNDWDL